MIKRDFDLPLYIPAGEIPDSIFSGSLPTTVVINKLGQVVFRHEGSSNYQSTNFVKFIDELLM